LESDLLVAVRGTLSAGGSTGQDVSGLIARRGKLYEFLELRGLAKDGQLILSRDRLKGDNFPRETSLSSQSTDQNLSMPLEPPTVPQDERSSADHDNVPVGTSDCASLPGSGQGVAGSEGSEPGSVG
jgi:hypothetical protein